MPEFCCDQSQAAGEPIAGSAVTSTDVWIVLEYDHAWCGKAVPESDLPEPVKQQLLTWQADIAGARVQLIRGHRDVSRPGKVTFFVGVSALPRGTLVRFDLEDHADVVDLDVPGIVEALRAGDSVPRAEVVQRPVVLVCTNGKRDRCCAKWGMPLYSALAQQPQIDCWQTTHLGGHRFAPTLLTLPDGICYGRVELADAAPLATAIADDVIYEPARTLRGRTCLTAAQQAGESQWRITTGAREVGLTGAEENSGDDAFSVTLVDAQGHRHQCRVQQRNLGLEARPSCEKPPAAVRGWFAVT